MNCQDIKPFLALYGDGALESSDHLRVEGHLRDCPACRKEVLALQQSWDLLGELEAIEPDPFFVSRFMARVAERVPWHDRLIRSMRRALAPGRTLSAVAAAGLIVAVGVAVLVAYPRQMERSLAEAPLYGMDLEMVETIELAEQFELIKDLDFISDMDIIDSLDEPAVS
jgi:predicted anti-sigma-YlaC factor YlaD